MKSTKKKKKKCKTLVKRVIISVLKSVIKGAALTFFYAMIVIGMVKNPHMWLPIRTKPNLTGMGLGFPDLKSRVWDG